MNHASLFSGMGGFDLAAEWMGWVNVFNCEVDPFCRKILSYYWPNTKSYGKIEETDFTIWRGGVDILTGGFPCQPFSTAGKRKGTKDDRYLWPEMLRAVREIQPHYVVAENVHGLINMQQGMVFEKVCSDLENEGYQVQPYILPAAAINAPHRRDRVWIAAYRYSNGFLRNNATKERHEHSSRRQTFGNINPYDGVRNASNTNCIRLQGRQKNAKKITKPTNEQFKGQHFLYNWENFPTQSPVCSGDDGISSKLDGITFSKWRKESIKAAGNAIVPGVVFEIFKIIDNERRDIKKKVHE